MALLLKRIGSSNVCMRGWTRLAGEDNRIRESSAPREITVFGEETWGALTSERGWHKGSQKLGHHVSD